MSLNSNGSTRNSEAAIGAPPKADIAPFQKAKLSLTDAIHTAQQQHKGKTLEARFEMWKGQPAYLVRTCANDQIWEGRINATTGQVIGQPRTFTSGRSMKLATPSASLEPSRISRWSGCDHTPEAVPTRERRWKTPRNLASGIARVCRALR